MLCGSLDVEVGVRTAVRKLTSHLLWNDTHLSLRFFPLPSFTDKSTWAVSSRELLFYRPATHSAISYEKPSAPLLRALMWSG